MNIICSVLSAAAGIDHNTMITLINLKKLNMDFSAVITYIQNETSVMFQEERIS